MNLNLTGLLFLIWISKSSGQNLFIRDCNDQIILDHMVNMGATGFLHSFCYHSCGYNLFGPTPGSLETCTADGMCLCQSVCDNPPPVTKFGDQCPPYPFSDPPDPDPNWEPQCLQRCHAVCADGESMVCGETLRVGLGPGMNEWAKICTCYCPPQACTTPTPPINITTTTPTPTTQISIVAVPNPKIILYTQTAKLIVFIVLLIKLCMSIWIIKLTLLCFHLYEILLGHEKTDNVGWSSE